MKEHSFEQLLKHYCGPNAIAHEVVLGEYRGTTIYSFKRKIKKYRFTNDYFHKSFPFKWSDISDHNKVAYIDEFYMCITDYDLEFEDACETILQDNTRELAIKRIEHEIDKQYALQCANDNVM